MPLVLVSSHPGLNAEAALANNYIHIDWGTAFDSLHGRAFPHRPIAAVRSNSGKIALELIRAGGGSAYLPQVMVGKALSCGELHAVPDAPVFEMHIYAAYHAQDENREILERMLSYLQG